MPSSTTFELGRFVPGENVSKCMNSRPHMVLNANGPTPRMKIWTYIGGTTREVKLGSVKQASMPLPSI